MSVKFIDFPSVIEVKDYDKLKTKLIEQLLSHASVLSVYQMGSVKNPGISDLDLICVFKNDSENRLNLRKDLSKEEKLILTHGIFGVEKKDLSVAIPYNMLSNLQLLGGEDLSLDAIGVTTDEDLKIQIAIEYLVKMFVALDTQKTLGIVKLRSFLLLAKAISFDLELLNIKDGKLFDLVQQVFEFRARWYNNQPRTAEVRKLVVEFHKELKLLLEKLSSSEKFYLPVEEINLPGNFNIKKADEFKSVHKGIVLPNQFKFLGKKYINLQYRLNQFEYSIPFEVPKEASIQQDRFKFTRYLVEKNKNNYPSFVPIMSSLSIY